MASTFCEYGYTEHSPVAGVHTPRQSASVVAELVRPLSGSAGGPHEWRGADAKRIGPVYGGWVTTVVAPVVPVGPVGLWPGTPTALAATAVMPTIGLAR